MIQVGANDNETITINLEKIDAKSLGLDKLSLNGPQGTVATAANSDVESFLSVSTGSVTAGASAAVTITNGKDLGSTAPTSGSLVKDSKGNLFVEVTATAGATKPGVNTGQKMYVSVKASAQI
ncbi:hypothetical protein G6F35_017948 [Rhizopus arrhizus]|nr:hypothetical protein G6F35_017948 [Rhizopus arrhizus]